MRYKQAAFGVAWAILQPALTMGVFAVFFGLLAKVPSDGVPYPLFAFAGLLPWQVFSRALLESSTGLVLNQNMVRKVYFPRVVLVAAPLLAALLDFALAFLVLAGLMAWYGVAPGLPILALPIFLVLALASALAVGLWLSALNVKYRDIQQALPFLTQVWLFATPIAYPASLVPEKWRWLYGLNPMAGVVEGFRWSLFGGDAPDGLVAVSAGVVAVLLVGGFLYFHRVERTFADVI